MGQEPQEQFESSDLHTCAYVYITHDIHHFLLKFLRTSLWNTPRCRHITAVSLVVPIWEFGSTNIQNSKTLILRASCVDSRAGAVNAHRGDKRTTPSIHVFLVRREYKLGNIGSLRWFLHTASIYTAFTAQVFWYLVELRLPRAGNTHVLYSQVGVLRRKIVYARGCTDVLLFRRLDARCVFREALFAITP